MYSDRRISLDSANMRGRLRGYTPRPVLGTHKRPPLTLKNNIEDIQPLPSVKIASTAKPNYISEIKQAPVKPMSAELQIEARQLINKMEDDEQASAQVAREEYATFPMPRHKSKVADLKDKTIAAASSVNKSYLLTGAAVVFIVVGSALGLNGFKSNQKIEAQVKALSSYDGVENTPDKSPVLDETKLPANSNDTYAVAPTLPKLLKIPSIKINARVRRVILDNNNSLQAPASIYDAGWYDGSAKPGEDGAMFIDGHVSGPTEHGVFFYLHKLKIGEIITVERGDGKEFNYKVVAAELFDADKVDMKKVLQPLGGARQGLNLMTYGGKFIPSKQEYDKRLVVYAVLQ